MLSNENPEVAAGSPETADWLECGEGGTSQAISQLRDDPSKQRKLFLAGCGWARRYWERLGKRSRTAVEVFEQFADQEVAVDGFFADLLQQFLRFEVFAYVLEAHLNNDERDAAHPLAAYFNAMILAEGAWKTALTYLAEPDAERGIVLPARGVFSLSRGAYIDASDEFNFAGDGDGAGYQAQCHIMRDVFADPSRPVSLEASWLSTNEGTVANIAAAIYDERAFERMPELADALEQSGCHNQSMLEHCRAQGEHVRGCWVLDLLLEKDKLIFPLGARMPLAFQPDQAE